MNDHDNELRAALRRLPAPEASPDLLPRILRNRAMGVRIKSPSGKPAIPWGWLATAAVVTLLIGGSWMLSVSLTRMRESRVGARDPIGELLRGRLWRSEEGLGEPLPETIDPHYGLILSGSLERSRLSEGLWTYASMTTTDGILSEPSFNGGTRIRMTRGSYNGEPAWAITHASRFRRELWSVFADTTYLDAATLRPRYAVSYWNRNRTRLVETFSAGRAFQSITITGPMESHTAGIMELTFPSDALFTNDWMFEHEFRVLVPALPFAKGWRGSLYQTGLFAVSSADSIKPRAYPVNLRVVGTDRVSVPAGRFDCWRVEVESYISGIDQWTMWVSRDKGWVIKTEFGRSGYVRDEVLESYEPGN